MVTTTIEPLAHLLLTGLVELAFEAWQELESEHLDVPYNPDWEAYQNREIEGRLRFFALRDDKSLIGYASIIIDTDIHRSGLIVASFRDIYVTKQKRGYAPFFVKYIEKTLCSLGVKRVWAAERISAKNNSGKFFEVMGFEQQECLWGKTIN